MNAKHYAIMLAIVLAAYVVGRKYPTLLPSIGGY